MNFDNGKTLNYYFQFVHRTALCLYDGWEKLKGDGDLFFVIITVLFFYFLLEAILNWSSTMIKQKLYGFPSFDFSPGRHGICEALEWS